VELIQPPRVPLDEPGLTSDQAAALLAEHGPNELVPERRRHTPLYWVARGLADPMVLLLLAAGAVYLAIGSTEDAVVVAIAVGPIALVGVLLELRSDRALEGLRRLTAPLAKVLRDGLPRTIPSRELVPGDLVFLEEGQVIPADGVVEESANLQVDESALTGESLPVAKIVGDPLLAGTTVLGGRGAALLRATGRTTEYGRLGGLVATIKQPPTPLERLIRRVMVGLGGVAFTFCVVVAAAELFEGHGWGAALIAGVSLAIAAIPEEFPVVYTLYLALGAWRLAKEKALVRRLGGVEALGAATVICTDKTGTLTAGRLTMVAAECAPGVPRRELLQAAVLACEPKPFDPMEAAILDFAAREGVEVERLHQRELVADYPLDSHDHYLSHVWLEGGEASIAAKGSLEGVTAHSIAEPARFGWAESANCELAGGEIRVLAVAGGRLSGGPEGRAVDERQLRLLGLVGFSDPIRPGVVEAVRECHEAGIRVVMVTGDHALTAAAVGRKIGIDTSKVVSGAQLEAADQAGLLELARSASIFSRIRPEQKHRLVEALRADGQVVAMTGDGINDAPALREADIGVAMGARGTEVAREAATLVLLDDNFATIVNAIRNGRRIFLNLQRAFAYLIAFHLPLLLAAAAVPILGLPLLLLPVHLVILELFLHPSVSLVFEAEPAPPDVMRRPPRPARAGLMPARVLARALAAGATLFVAVIALYWWRLAAGDSEYDARSIAFVALLLGQVLILLIERSRPALVFQPARWLDRTTVLTIGPVVVAIAIATYVPPLATMLRLGPLDALGWLLAVLTAAAATLWQELMKSGRRDESPGLHAEPGS